MQISQQSLHQKSSDGQCQQTVGKDRLFYQFYLAPPAKNGNRVPYKKCNKTNGIIQKSLPESKLKHAEDHTGKSAAGTFVAVNAQVIAGQSQTGQPVPDAVAYSNRHQPDIHFQNTFAQPFLTVLSTQFII